MASAELQAALLVAVIEGAWRVGVLAPGLIPPGQAAGALAAWLGVPLPAVNPTRHGPPALAPHLPTSSDLDIRVRPEVRRWLDRLMSLAPGTLPTSAWQAVVAAYTGPGRHYHTLEHLAELAERYMEVSAGPGWEDPEAAWLALLFHDAVYTVDPTRPRGENERRSAALLLAHFPEAHAAAELIRATADHHAPAAPVHASPSDLAHFLDADLSILGAPPARFARYGRQVAAEYVPVVGQDAYDAGRAAFFAHMLQTPALFHSPFFRDRLEARARRNLRAGQGACD